MGKADVVIGGIDIRDVAGCTCLRLRRTTRRATQIYDRALAPAGVTITQLGLLGHLYGALVQEREGLSIGLLAERVGMDPTTLNRNLKPLEDAEFVGRGLDPDDRRVRTIRITTAGIAKLGEATPLWRRAQDYIDGRLGPEIAAALNNLLDLSAAKLTAP